MSIRDNCEEDRRFKAEIIQTYAQAINKVDDYFEYRYESETDKQYVRQVLNDVFVRCDAIKRKYQES